MHHQLARQRASARTDTERSVERDEELAVAREELDALKEGLDASFRTYRDTPTHPAAWTLRAMLQQTLLALRTVEWQRGRAESP